MVYFQRDKELTYLWSLWSLLASLLCSSCEVESGLLALTLWKHIDLVHLFKKISQLGLKIIMIFKKYSFSY